MGFWILEGNCDPCCRSEDGEKREAKASPQVQVQLQARVPVPVAAPAAPALFGAACPAPSCFQVARLLDDSGMPLDEALVLAMAGWAVARPRPAPAPRGYLGYPCSPGSAPVYAVALGPKKKAMALLSP